MALDSHYIPAFSIEDVLLSKDTGAPLSGGLVYFYEDLQRGVLKDIYQIAGTSPDYSYVQLTNPITLSSIGTFADDIGNPIIPYFYPYDGAGNVELYYIKVTSADGVEQFTREAQPYVVSQGTPSEVLSAYTNELTNPQFAEVNFDTSAGAYTYSFPTPVVDNVVAIAPGWDLIVSTPGAGSVTVTRNNPAASGNLLTNAGSLLTIGSAGLTKLQLRQRLHGSGNLWGSGYISATFVAKTYSGTPVTLNMRYSQSGGTVTNQLLVAANLPSSGAYAAYPGSKLIDSSNNPQTFPTAYIDIFFEIPLSIQIDITSVMVTFTGDNSIPNMTYDQESYERQVDHMYHTAAPIVPVGTVIDYHGFDTPAHYTRCNGGTLDRILYQKLFRVVTRADVATWVTTTAFTVPSSVDYWIGMHVEGASIPASTTITNIVGNTITISNVRTGTLTSVRFFSVGGGDSVTTFNAPNLQDYVTAGAGGTLFGAGNNGIGKRGGSATHAQTITEMPLHNHPTSSASYVTGTGGGGTLPTPANNTPSVSNAVTLTIAAQGGGTLNTSGTPMTIVQQTALVRKLIRYE